MRPFDGSVDVGDGRRYAKVVFPVEDEPGVESESMWTEVLPGGLYRIKNIPVWKSGVSLEDVVAGRRDGDQIRYQSVRQRAGHSTYRIALQDSGGTARQQPELDRLIKMGCGCERASKRLVAIDVPAEVDIDAIYGLLEAGMAQGTWWFDELHCGHPLGDPSRPGDIPAR
jgi:hypothetical protein